MTEVENLVAQLEFARGRSLDLLKRIEDHDADTQEILAWRPGPGRAHLGWQLMHLAATEDRYLNVRILEKKPKDAKLVEDFAGGSTPDDGKIPTSDAIREALSLHREPLLAHYRALNDSQLDDKPFPDAMRTYRESAQLIAWHEAHHHGQAHITLNLFDAQR